jgi:hypothetical protein
VTGANRIAVGSLHFIAWSKEGPFMIEQSLDQPGIKRPLISIAILAAAWLGFFITMEYRAYLEDHFGPRPDVYDALVCAGYVAVRTWPWLLGVVLLDGLAYLASDYESRRGISAILQVGIVLLVLVSGFLHGLVLAGIFFFSA